MAAASSQPSGYRWLYLSLELNLETYREVFYSQILPAVKPEWRPQELDCHVFKSGVTNVLVAFYQRQLGLQNSGKDVILLRVDGIGTEKIINRTDEVVTILSLSQVGLCSPLYAQLKNGICYGYFPGRRLKVHETSSNHFIMRKIARSMAKLHSLEMPRHFVDREPFLWMKMEEFMRSVPTSFPDQEVFVASIGSIEKLQDEIEFTRDLILKECSSPVVFCHNDIHSANIIYNEETDDLTLIDYEYAGPNYFAFDIADHFCEFAGLENIDYQRYPDEAVQKMWIRMYLEEMQKVKVSVAFPGEEKAIEEKAIHNLYREVNTFVLGCHLLWVAWALFQAANSNIDFDFMEYAALRFAEYIKRKSLLATL